MSSPAAKHLKSLLRWGVAALGAWYVLAQLTWHDRVLAILDPTNIPRWATVTSGDENSSELTVRTLETSQTRTISRDAVVSEPDRKAMTVLVNNLPPRPGAGQAVLVLGVDLIDRSRASRLLIEDEHGNSGLWVPVEQTNYQVTLPHPRVQIGVEHLISRARHWYLFWALIIFPLTFVITSYRWHELLKALDVRLTPGRSFVLNMVGAFYNTFMPGSTGGDVLKAYYVARQTHHRTRAVMSVVVDRVIGLLALIILGGTMATYASLHWHIHQTAGVALFSLAICTATGLGLLVFYHTALRRWTGLDWMLRRLPMQERVGKAVETMHLYGKRPGLAAAALLVSFPVHAVVIISASLAGTAFGLHIPWYYYWTVVPVTVLAGSIPISPQGAGVMEYFAIWLVAPLGCTVAEAVALTLSIRLVQVFWNLTGGLFVLRGGYHTPTSAEEQQVEVEDEDKQVFRAM